MDFEIITCPTWRARQPKSPIAITGPAEEIIFHHTAGHHRDVDRNTVETRDEALQYARDIQNFHMNTRGWIDSGHNFLVCRSGHILQGRWKTVSAIQVGKMVISAHCPGHNDDIGIEHEHNGSEEMTKVQKEASSWLQAWIAWKYKRRTVLPVNPHSKYFATSCPANLKEDISAIRSRAAEILKGGNL